MAITDQALEAKIAETQTAIMIGAQSHQLWYDTGFQTYAHRVDAELGEVRKIHPPLKCSKLLRGVWAGISVW